MEYFVENGILHIVYQKNCKNTEKFLNIENISNNYEGVIKSRIGFNFPIEFVKKFDKHNELLKYSAKYVIVYKKGDISTKKHELQHAKFYIDNDYRKNIENLWNSFNIKTKNHIEKMLEKMGYDRKVFLDEFQAYYFTEKSNFFGIKLI